MRKAARHFNIGLMTALAVSLAMLPSGFAGQEISKSETGLYRDTFDRNVYDEGTNMLRLERLWRFLTRKKVPSLNVNAFDEVPDNQFFTNRHARQRLSAEQLRKGYAENSGPDLSSLTVLHGIQMEQQAGFFVKDSRGDEYLLKFDSQEGFELAIASEVIASRFFYAIGYNVPQMNVATFAADKASIDPSAWIYESTGFKEKLTQDNLQKYLMFVPQDEKGAYRVSAMKKLAGEPKGFYGFQGRRHDDPSDQIEHERLREVRALRVFASWLNLYDLREGNTADMLVMDNGKPVLKHYLTDFNDAFGSAFGGAKPPYFGHEYLVDFGEATKAFFSLGLWEKPWQKRWREAGSAVNGSLAIGYFDNQHFNPGTFKPQLPHYAFKDLSRADAFWAAKIIMSFTDEDVREMVKAGEFIAPADADTLAKILIERRDMIGKYWFAKSSPLDDFDLQGNQLTFKDLAVEHGFETSAKTVYQTSVYQPGQTCKPGHTSQSAEAAVDLGSQQSVDVKIHVLRSGVQLPYVSVKIRDGRIAGITHED